MQFICISLHRLLIKLRAELATGADAQGQGIHWSEFVADLWNARLPHLKQETHTERGGEVICNPSTNRYGFEDQSKDFSDDEHFIHGLENDEELAPKAISKEDLATKAKTYTPEDVGDFLASIKLDEYRHLFVEENVGGDVLLEAGDCEFLMELGVKSYLDCARIITLFPRRLQEAEPRLPISEVLRFLRENRLEKYVKLFEQHEIDGDMLMDNGDFKFLIELGVKSYLDCARIITLFPRRLQEAEPRFPISEVLRFLRENKLEKYVELFEHHEIDGDMLVDTELTKKVLKEIGIGLVDTRKIVGKFSQ